MLLAPILYVVGYLLTWVQTTCHLMIDVKDMIESQTSMIAQLI